jgi:hypothetical protein
MVSTSWLCVGVPADKEGRPPGVEGEARNQPLLGSEYEVPPSADPDAPEPHDLTR